LNGWTQPIPCRIEHVCIAESAHEDHTPELVEGYAAVKQVGHGNVPGFEACEEEGGDHFAVAVASLFPDNRHLRPGCAAKEVFSRLRRREGNDEGRTLAVVDVLPFFADALGVPLHKVEPVARFFPDVAENEHVLVDNSAFGVWRLASGVIECGRARAGCEE
jgi:hypothetical protein